jgi:hypothetical protein
METIEKNIGILEIRFFEADEILIAELTNVIEHFKIEVKR